MFPKRGEKQKGGYSWLVFALLSALFAALTSTLSKLGAAGVDADLGTAVRATVMLPMAWLIPILSGKISDSKKSSPKRFHNLSVGRGDLPFLDGLLPRAD